MKASMRQVEIKRIHWKEELMVLAAIAVFIPFTMKYFPQEEFVLAISSFSFVYISLSILLYYLLTPKKLFSTGESKFDFGNRAKLSEKEVEQYIYRGVENLNNAKVFLSLLPAILILHSSFTNDYKPLTATLLIIIFLFISLTLIAYAIRNFIRATGYIFISVGKVVKRLLSKS